MGNKGIRKRIESLLRRIREHELKIQAELAKNSPDEGLIQHWKVEIDAFEISINRAKKRLL